MSCIQSDDCGRFECLYENECQHLGPFSYNLLWQFLLLILPFAVGVANASSFGTVTIQIFVFSFLYNYGKKQTAANMLPLSSGIFIANTINNFGKRHPKLNTLLIDTNLAVKFIPNMISGLVAGIHFKDYVPPLFMTIFTIFQLSILIMSTQMKYKQLKQLDETKEQINKFQKKDEGIIPIYSFKFIHSTEIFEDILNQSIIQMDDQIIIDYEQIFQLIQKSPHKQLYLDKLPEELKNLDLIVMNNQVKVIDFIKQNYDANKINNFKDQLVHENKQEKKQFKTHIVLVVLTVTLNLAILLFKSKIDQNITTPGCKANYWSAFYLQFTTNFLIYLYITIGKIDPSLIFKLWVLSFLGGFLLGLVGMGVALFLVLGLVKLNISKGGMPSIGATLPLIFSVVTTTGSFIQLITGSTDFLSLVAFEFLGFIGQKYTTPKLSLAIKQKGLALKSTKYASVFQKILLILFIGIQLPKIIKTPLLIQLTPQPYCV